MGGEGVVQDVWRKKHPRGETLTREGAKDLTRKSGPKCVIGQNGTRTIVARYARQAGEQVGR